MNLGLLDPFDTDYPERIEEYLEHKVTKCIAFNRRGTILAGGCIDGSIVLWDLATRSVNKELCNGDSRAPITSLSWSKCGRRLLSADTERSLTLWDVQAGEKLAYKKLNQTALYARLHPGTKDPSVCLVCPVSSAPLLVDFETGDSHVLPLQASSSVADVKQIPRGKQGDLGSYASSAASFNKRGDLIYIGNSRGEMLIVDTKEREIRAVVETPVGQVIKQVVFSRDGLYLLTNSGDKTIRIFASHLPVNGAATVLEEWGRGAEADLETLKDRGTKCLTFKRSFKDAINPAQWKAPCFSGDSESVVAASANKGEHKITIWNREFGQMMRVLEGPKEGLVDLAWHPIRPLLASVTMAGLVYLWARDYTESWSAFAPDFKELQENEEYCEREDEFDLMPPEPEKANSWGEVDEDVDIMTVDRVPAYSDSDDSDDGLYYLPTKPEGDVPVEVDVQQPTSPKVNGRSNSDSGGSPLSAADQKQNREVDGDTCTEADMEVDEPDPSSSHLGDSPMEEEIGPNGRTKRKRKIPEKAAEFQAEMDRKSQKKVNSVTTPRPKTDTKVSPTAASKGAADGEEESESEGGLKAQKLSSSSTPSAKAESKDLSGSLKEAASGDDDSDFQDDQLRRVHQKSVSEVTLKAVNSTKSPVPAKTKSSRPGAVPKPGGSATKPVNSVKLGATPKPAGALKPVSAKSAGVPKTPSAPKSSGAQRPPGVLKPAATPGPAGPLKPASSPKPAVGPKPAPSPKPAGGLKLGAGLKSGATPKPVAAPKPAGTPRPTAAAKPAAAPKSTGAMKPGSAAKTAAAPKSAPRPSSAPKPSGAPRPAGVSKSPAANAGTSTAVKSGSATKIASGTKTGAASKPGNASTAGIAPRPGTPKVTAGSRNMAGPNDEDDDAPKRTIRLKSVSDFTSGQPAQAFYRSGVIK